MKRLYICRKCDKPKARKVEGKPRSGKRLITAAKDKGIDLDIVPCSCLGKCKKGPNGVAMPGKLMMGCVLS